ncbi:MAG: NAD-dependent epimerase/dehydratase family protein [Bryobacteraceae bacterium]|nr:NAD-dependent epimerase/dehydratase family protein [Bryobacteraceae bacterium]
MSYHGKHAVVTGGLGFIGSNLAIRLVELGASVVVLDPQTPGCGGNPFNIESVRDRMEWIPADLADPASYRHVISKADVVFNLAGEISHVHSMQFPERDLQINALAQLRLLTTCAEIGVKARIVYAGTRQVYGVPKYQPVDEGHPIQAVDFNGVHKFAASQYHLMLSRSGLLDCVVLRLTNVYGPRMALDVVCQGFLSTFVRRAVLGQQIEIFGNGQQLRDPVYVDDAVEAFLLAGLAERLSHRSFNVGGPEAVSVAEVARIASQLGGCAVPIFRPFPEDREPIDIGSYRSDYRRISREFGWYPQVQFADGLQRTIEFYKLHLPWYLDTSELNPTCRMPEHHGAPGRLTYVPATAVVP